MENQDACVYGQSHTIHYCLCLMIATQYKKEKGEGWSHMINHICAIQDV